MKIKKRKIIIDVDDTILNSSEEIIRQLNNKNKTNFTIKDLKCYNYKDIDPNLDKIKLLEIFENEDFFKHVLIRNECITLFKKYENIFDFHLVSYGTFENLEKKKIFFAQLIYLYSLSNVHMDFCEFGKRNKSQVLLPDVYLAIDDDINSLQEVQSPKKILIKNYLNVSWNQVPVNSDIYVVNSFEEIEQMIDFDLELQNQGIIIE